MSEGIGGTVLRASMSKKKRDRVTTLEFAVALSGRAEGAAPPVASAWNLLQGLTVGQVTLEDYTAQPLVLAGDNGELKFRTAVLEAMRLQGQEDKDGLAHWRWLFKVQVEDSMVHGEDVVTAAAAMVWAEKHLGQRVNLRFNPQITQMAQMDNPSPTDPLRNL